MEMLFFAKMSVYRNTEKNSSRLRSIKGGGGVLLVLFNTFRRLCWTKLARIFYIHNRMFLVQYSIHDSFIEPKKEFDTLGCMASDSWKCISTCAMHCFNEQYLSILRGVHKGQGNMQSYIKLSLISLSSGNGFKLFNHKIHNRHFEQITQRDAT